jgi:hypothetical protein
MSKKREIPQIVSEFDIKINSLTEFQMLTKVIGSEVGTQTDENNKLRWRFRKRSIDGDKLTGARCRLIRPLTAGKPQRIVIEIFTKDHTLDETDLMMIKVKSTD